MEQITRVSASDRIAFYQREISRRTPARGRHASLMVKIYRNLLASAIESQQLEEHNGEVMHG